MDEKVQRHWTGGFLLPKDLRAFEGKWPAWQPDRPHLIVFDYVLGSETELGEVLAILAQRADRFEKKVRVLLIERQPWNESGLKFKWQDENGYASAFVTSSGQSEWFAHTNKIARLYQTDLSHEKYRLKSGIINLNRKIEVDHLISIIRQIEKQDRAGRRISQNDKFIEESLACIDKSGRPLYAYFLAQALLDGTFQRDWEEADLLDHILRTNREMRWPKPFGGQVPKLGQDHPAIRLACLATMTGVLDCEVFDDATCPEWPFPDDDTIRQAWALNEVPVGGDGNITSFAVRALQPDILGEWFVLTSLPRKPMRETVVDAAWRIASHEMADFLIRLARDFPQNVVANKIINHRPSKDNYDKIEYARVAKTLTRSTLKYDASI